MFQMSGIMSPPRILAHVCAFANQSPEEEELVEPDPIEVIKKVAGVDEKEIAHSKAMHAAEQNILKRQKCRFLCLLQRNQWLGRCLCLDGENGALGTLNQDAEFKYHRLYVKSY